VLAAPHDRHVKTEAESHTIGIVLCKKRIPLWSRLPFPKMPIFTPVNTSFACPARKSCNRNSRNGWGSRKSRKPIAFRASPWQCNICYRSGIYISCLSFMIALFPNGNIILDVGETKD
jgi:hypothetical protein